MEPYFLVILTASLLPYLASASQIGLNFYPKPDEEKSRLIWFNETTYGIWSQKLDNFIEYYRRADQDPSENAVDCSYESPPQGRQACRLNVEQFKPCVASNYFGYKKAKPCVFFQISRIGSEWEPKYYNKTKALPKEMPQTLKLQIDDLTNDPNMWKNIWLSCDGDTAADKELIGPVKYLPIPGFPGYFFPNTGYPEYISPLVAVQFTRPAHGVVINVVCKVWAPGISHNYNKEIGLHRFELLIDF